MPRSGATQISNNRSDAAAGRVIDREKIRTAVRLILEAIGEDSSYDIRDCRLLLRVRKSNARRSTRGVGPVLHGRTMSRPGFSQASFVALLLRIGSFQPGRMKWQV